MAKSNINSIPFNYPAHLNAFRTYARRDPDKSRVWKDVYYAIFGILNDQIEYVGPNREPHVPETIHVYRSQIQRDAVYTERWITKALQDLERKGYITNYNSNHGHSYGITFSVVPLDKQAPVPLEMEDEPEKPEKQPKTEKQPKKEKPEQPVQQPTKPVVAPITKKAGFDNTEFFTDVQIRAAASDLDDYLKNAIRAIRTINKEKNIHTHLQFYMDVKDKEGVIWGRPSDEIFGYCTKLVIDALNTIEPETIVKYMDGTEKGGLSELMRKTATKWANDMLTEASSKGNEKHYKYIIERLNPYAMYSFQNIRDILQI